MENEYSIKNMLMGNEIRAKLKGTIFKNKALIDDFMEKLLVSRLMTNMFPDIVEHGSIVSENEISIHYTIANPSLIHEYTIADLSLNASICIMLFHYLHNYGYLNTILSDRQILFLLDNEKDHCIYLIDIFRFNFTDKDGKDIIVLKLNF